MILLVLLLVLVLAALSVLVVSENPQLVTVYVAYFEISASIGVIIVSAFGFGILTGMISMLARDIPRWQRVRELQND